MVLSGNSASGWGPVFGTEDFSAALSPPEATMRTGDGLSPELAIADGYGQVVAQLPRSDVQLSCDDPVLPREVPNVYRAGRRLTGITVTGNVTQSYVLTATAVAPALPVPLTATMTVTIEPCRLLELFNNETLLCDCVTGAEHQADGRCGCADGLHEKVVSAVNGTVQPGAAAMCSPCPARGAICMNGLIIPKDGFWHSKCASSPSPPPMIPPTAPRAPREKESALGHTGLTLDTPTPAPTRRLQRHVRGRPVLRPPVRLRAPDARRPPVQGPHAP